MRFLCFTPVACPSILSRVNTQGSGITQATGSRTLPNVTVEDTRSTKDVRTIKTGMTTIQPIRTFNVTRISLVRMRKAVKSSQVDWTVNPAITTQLNRGRLYYLHHFQLPPNITVLAGFTKNIPFWLLTRIDHPLTPEDFRRPLNFDPPPAMINVNSIVDIWNLKVYVNKKVSLNFHQL